MRVRHLGEEGIKIFELLCERTSEIISQFADSYGFSRPELSDQARMSLSKSSEDILAPLRAAERLSMGMIPRFVEMHAQTLTTSLREASIGYRRKDAQSYVTNNVNIGGHALGSTIVQGEGNITSVSTSSGLRGEDLREIAAAIGALLPEFHGDDHNDLESAKRVLEEQAGRAKPQSGMIRGAMTTVLSIFGAAGRKVATDALAAKMQAMLTAIGA